MATPPPAKQSSNSAPASNVANDEDLLNNNNNNAAGRGPIRHPHQDQVQQDQANKKPRQARHQQGQQEQGQEYVPHNHPDLLSQKERIVKETLGEIFGSKNMKATNQLTSDQEKRLKSVLWNWPHQTNRDTGRIERVPLTTEPKSFDIVDQSFAFGVTDRPGDFKSLPFMKVLFSEDLLEEHHKKDQEDRIDMLFEHAEEFAKKRKGEALDLVIFDGAGRVLASIYFKLHASGLLQPHQAVNDDDDDDENARGYFRKIKVYDVTSAMVDYHKIVFPQPIFEHKQGNVFNDLLTLGLAKLKQTYFYANFSGLITDEAGNFDNVVALLKKLHALRPSSPPFAISWSLLHDADKHPKLKSLREFLRQTGGAGAEIVRKTSQSGKEDYVTFFLKFGSISGTAAAYQYAAQFEYRCKCSTKDDEGNVNACTFVTESSELGIKAHIGKMHKAHKAAHPIAHLYEKVAKQ